MLVASMYTLGYIEPTDPRKRNVDLHSGSGNSIRNLKYQNLGFCSVHINSVLGFIVRAYRKVGYGSLPIGPIVVPSWGEPYRILKMNPQRELLWGLWVIVRYYI